MICAYPDCEAINDDQRSWAKSIDCISASVSSIDSIDNFDVMFKQLDGFLEDPTLLDPHLSTWLPALADKASFCLRNDDSEKMQRVFQVFNQFCKVCGVSTIRPYFPHDLETSRMLMTKAPHLIEQSEDWAVRTMLFTWSSLAVLVPFQMAPESLNGLISLAISKLALSGKECSAAAMFLSAVIRRSDSPKDILDKVISGPLSNGALEMLVNLLKTGTQLEPFKSNFFQFKASLDQTSPSSFTKKLNLRFLTRLCMVFSEEEGIVEETIGLLIESLSDRDTKLRWTAAKGIARLATFLDDEDIGQIVTHLCSLDASPDILHGCCLALGQVLSSTKVQFDHEARSGLVQFLLAALRFEVSKGTYSVGSHVRDAACYTCWAWCKYQRIPDDVVTPLAGRLLSLSLFDREIGCRRAGSAAFQELVGRTGAVPRGIELMTLVDFYSIASISRCYGELFQQAAQYSEYKEALVDHLVQVSCKSFDKNIRNFAASALGTIDLETPVLNTLFSYANDQLDPNNVHVGLVTISHLLNRACVDVTVLQESFTGFAALENSRKPGYQLLAESWLTFILAHIKSTELVDEVRTKILAIVKTCLRSRFPELHSGVCFDVLQSLSSQVTMDDPATASFYRTVVLPAADKDFDPNAQRGFSAVIGSMPEWLFKDRLGPLTNLLCRLASTTEPINDVDKRALIIKAIGQLHGRYSDCLSKDAIIQVFTCLLAQLDDYSMDSRGDVGSYIREASMSSLCLLLPVLESDMVTLLHAKILQQALDRLDRVRWLAFDCLNEYEWPIKLSGLSKLAPQRIFEAITETDLLSNPVYRAYLLQGWINSAGCPTPSVSDPSWAHLATHMSVVLRHVLSPEAQEVYWSPESRLCKPLLSALQRWAASTSNTEYTSNIAAHVIERICKQKRCSIHVLIEAFQLLKALPCEEARQFVEQSSRENPYPRIRQLCTS